MSNRNKQTPALKTSLSFAPFTFLVGSFESVTENILEKIAERKSTIILSCSLNDLALSAKSRKNTKLYKEVDICTTDGMPLVWWARWNTKGHVERVYGPDLMRAILAKTQGSSFRHFFVGASDKSLSLFRSKLKKLAPNINVVGTLSLKTKSDDEKEARNLRRIKRTKPSTLWVGVGSPKGVELAAAWRRHLPNTIIFCVGAAIEFFSGVKPTAPVWIQRTGLEWLFRLAVEPRRLWKRYLIDIPLFLIFYLPVGLLKKAGS